MITWGLERARIATGNAHVGTLRLSACSSAEHKQTRLIDAPSAKHLEERVLDQAPVAPLWGGRSRSIPQGMVLDVRLLVNSLFCPIKQSSNGFLYAEASIP